ncbi:MerR family transcriptional regulator [Caballeronia pedi]
MSKMDGQSLSVLSASTNMSGDPPTADSSLQESASEPASDEAATPERAPSHVASTAAVTGIGIAAIALEIGVTKDTLRVWERRYGFPRPVRTPGGERLYSPDQVTKLRLVKRLLDAGHRPSKVLGQPMNVLQHLAQSSGVGRDAPDAELDRLISLLRAGAHDDFRIALLKRATRDGLQRFVLDVAAPLSARVGNAWTAGTLQVYHEHLFSETLQSTMRNLMRPLQDALRGRRGHPRVLLTTLSGEGHGLGILMAEAMFTLSECECVPIGLQTPLHDIADAVAAHEIDIVALSFTASLPALSVASGLTDLRELLPPHIRIWVGGSSPALRRKVHDGVLHVPGLTSIDEAVEEWRQAVVR